MTETTPSNTLEHAETEIQTIWHKGQRVKRTIAQVVPAAVTGIILVIGLIPQIETALRVPADSKLAIALSTLSAWIVLAAGGLSRVFAIDAVDKALTKIGLGSVPRAIGKLAETTVSPVQDPEAVDAQ